MRLAVLALALIAASPADALVVRDMTGREVALAAPPARIVSLVPSVTETIFALGGEARLAGRTDWCDSPPAARDKPSVGGMINPSLEAIATLKPDLVIATDEGNREETAVQLRRLGIPTYLVHAHRVAEMLDMIARLGALVQRPDAVAPLVESIQARIDDVRRRVAGRRPPRVLYVLWPEPLIVPGRGSVRGSPPWRSEALRPAPRSGTALPPSAGNADPPGGGRRAAPERPPGWRPA